jgi:histidyl-tRNA synthetase
MPMEARILKGFRDYLPDAMDRRNFVVARLTEIFERFGFRPLQTPALEYYDVLAGKYGEEGQRLLYHFQDQGDRHVGLRYDLTVPLARVVAMHQDLPRPFRRYQVAPVWRAEKPAKGRFREFYQCDVDVVGSPSMLVEAELLSVLHEGMLALGIRGFEIRVNNRKLLDAATQLVGLGRERIADVCRSLDKLDKLGREGVEKELREQGLEAGAVRDLFAALHVEGTPAERVQGLMGAFSGLERGREALAELGELAALARAAGVPDKRLILEPTLARGLDYYTGTIVEVVLTEVQIGTVAAGGRYDGLIGQMSGHALPAAGVSFGLDRLLVALEELGIAPGERLFGPQVLVTLFDADSRASSAELATALRRAGVRTETAYEPEKLGKQFKHADRIGAALVVVEGPDERAGGRVTVKDLRRRTQESLERGHLVDYVWRLLKDEGAVPGAEEA